MIAAITPAFEESPQQVKSIVEHLLSYKNISQIVIALTREDSNLFEIESLVRSFTARNRVKISISEAPGRAVQMNNGASEIDAEIFLFVHCDTQLPNQADDLIIESMKTHQWGRFDVQFDDNKIIFKVVSWFMNKRSRLTGISTGDQAIFVKRELFQQLDGFPNQVLMEDVEFSKQARRIGLPAFVGTPVVTSARRWQQGGVIKTILLMWWLRVLYWFGVSPERLAQMYRQIR